MLIIKNGKRERERGEEKERTDCRCIIDCFSYYFSLVYLLIPSFPAAMLIEMLTMMRGKPKHKKKEVSVTREVIRPI